MSPDGINSRSIQMLLRGGNNLNWLDGIPATVGGGEYGYFLKTTQYRVLESDYLPGYIKAQAFSIKDALFFELVLIGSRLELMTFHKMSPRTHHNLLLVTKSLW